MSTGIEIKKKIAAKEEGVTITTDLNSLNFVGAGVNASVVSEEVTVTIPGSIGSTAYYLNQTITQSPYKEFTSIPTTAAEQDTATTIASGATAVIGAYQTPAGVPNTTSIPAGLWQFFLHLYSNVASDDWDVYVEVYKRDLGGIETLLFNTDLESVTNMSTSTTMYLLDGVFPTTSLLTTDRIVVKVLATNMGPGSQTIHMVTEGSAHYSVGTTTLNQVVGAGSVTSVTGTAPIASSGGTTPAISISQATSSTDGYLSSTDWSIFNSKRGQGIWGIADASGAYTYYTTLTLAMAAASTGQTIELFADTSESDTITLKNTVNINLNGHNYLWAYLGSSTFLRDNGVAVTCQILNGKITVEGLTTPSAGLLISGASNITTNVLFDMSNAYVRVTNANATLTGGTYIGRTSQNPVQMTTGTLKNIDSLALGLNMRAIECVGGSIYDSIGISRNSGSGNHGILAQNTRLYNCTGITTGNGYALHLTDVYAHNSVGRCSSTGWGIYCYTSNLFNCTGESSVGKGIHVEENSKLTNCTGFSASWDGIYVFKDSQLSNCTGISLGTGGITKPTLNTGITTLNNCSGSSYGSIGGIGVGDGVEMNNCTGYSALGSGIEFTNSVASVIVSNSTAIGGDPLSGGNALTINNTGAALAQINNTVVRANSTGNGIQVTSASNLTIANCTITVTSFGACIGAASAQSLKYVNNIYRGATTPIAATITQAQVNTEDNYGNILL